MRRFFEWVLSLSMMVAGAGAVSGQDYPNKPIRVVTVAVGGGMDIVSRMIAPVITGSWGQPLIIDNRGNSAAEIASRAPPDGYTLLGEGASFWIGPLLQAAPYDAVRDFSPITLTTSTPGILVVHPSVAAKSVKELIAVAKARPGELNYSAGSIGSSTHLSAELFKAMAGVDIARINYKGGAAALNAVLGGEVQVTFAGSGGMAAHIKSGRLRVLAVTSAEPSALMPGVPTVAASGVPGYEASSVLAMFTPAKTPAAIINRLNQEIVRALNRADVKDNLFNLGLEVVSGTPQQLAAKMKSDMVKWGKVIKDAGIKAD